MHFIFHIGEYPETASAMCIIELPSTQLPSKSIFSGLLEVLSLLLKMPRGQMNVYIFKGLQALSFL